MAKQLLPYGSWKSPVTADLIAAAHVELSRLCVDGDALYWIEARPDGRNVIVQHLPTGEITDVTPAGYSARSRVHEYGGAEYLVVDGIVYFSNFADQRLYRQAVGEVPQPMTKTDGMRYADSVMDFSRQRLIVVREDHSVAESQPVNTLVSVPLDGAEAEQVLVSGNDFYAAPRLNPGASRIAWLTWSHPNMPWDGTELWVGALLPDGTVGERRLVAGGPQESICQPLWSPDGQLYFVSDRTGWWNLYRWNEKEAPPAGVTLPLYPVDAEFAEPPWGFGTSNYSFDSDTRLVCVYNRHGEYRLVSLNIQSLHSEVIDTRNSVIGDIHVHNSQAYFVGGSETRPIEIVMLDLSTGSVLALRQSQSIDIDATYFSRPRAIQFPTDDNEIAHAFYYPPHSAAFEAPADTQPPLLVLSHGGPTGSTGTVFSYAIQFWTTRGFAVLDVNYRGSTGYGRAYRDRLKGAWGIADVADCVNGARYLVAQGLSDGGRLAIAGGSAGGYTVLCALTFYDTFNAGASYYGISDLEALARDTHKFESRYLDSLIGKYPEERDIYVERSPIHHVDQLACALVLFQGLDDPIVPPNQSQMMYDALRSRGWPVAYVSFPGEQHGFVQAENIKRSLEAELYFFARIFGFQPADTIEPIHIDNL